MQRLKAWGAVEKNGRRLRLINSSIVLGLPLGFGFFDALLPWLQHRYPVPVQHVACALQWISVLTVHFIPAHVQKYVAWNCTASGIPIPAIALIYAMLKIIIILSASIICTVIYATLIFSGDKFYIKYANIDLNVNMNIKFSRSNKIIAKSIIFYLPGLFVAAFAAFYFVFYIDDLKHIDFPINFVYTSGMCAGMMIPGTMVRIIYLAIKNNMPQ